MVAPSPRLFPQRLLLASAASFGLFAVGASALAANTEDMLKTAESVCLESAAALGWRPELAKVISSKAIDADKVEVVFDLTKDGINTARLTCPYSVSQGVGGAFAAPRAETAPVAAETAPVAAETARVAAETVAAPGTPVNQSRAWWLLLPLALGLGSWLFLLGRDEPVGHVYTSTATTTGTPTGTVHPETTATGAGTSIGGGARMYYGAEALARDGFLEVREQAEFGSRVLRKYRNGETFQITGVRRRDSSNTEWLEVSTGGWVRDGETRYDRNVVRFT